MAPPMTNGGAMSGASSSWPDSPAAATKVAICCDSMFSPSEFKNLTTAEVPAVPVFRSMLQRC